MTTTDQASGGADIALRVSEAAPRDAGRGIIRIDPQAMATLTVATGDVVQVTGRRSTVGRVLPLYPDDRGQGVIRMDGLTRRNAGTAIGERVALRRVTTAEGTDVVLRNTSRLAVADAQAIKAQLTGRPLGEGDRVRVNLVGARAYDLVLESTRPPGPVVVTDTTRVVIRNQPAEGADGHRVAYEDIGGLGHVLPRIREMVELPLRHPELFERLGIDPPKGVLLHGPPGCGKTLIARAVAAETAAWFTHVSGPEIMRKHYGESEAYLRSVFERARARAPAIVFLDELDAIAPRRTQVQGEVEKRVVAQLLALMDGLESRGQVIIIGATNIPDSLDPALRRPGRFDREIAIGVPDRHGRREILEIHARGMPLADDVDLDRLAAVAHGFGGADLEALCRESAMLALRRLLPRIDYSQPQIPPETLEELTVTLADFLQARRELEPSTIRDVYTEVPTVGWHDLGGVAGVQQTLLESVVWPLEHRAYFEQLHLHPPHGILLVGPPGTGKTRLAMALANECGLNFIGVRGPQLMSKYVGESEQGVREVFHKARQAAPCILFFDEIDSLVPRRGGGADAHVADRVVGQFLTEMDGLEELGDVIVLATTNRFDVMDPALLRPGRFDRIIEVPLPDAAARAEILAVKLRDRPVVGEVDVAALAAATEGWSGADLELLCNLAAVAVLRDAITTGQEPRIDGTRLAVALAEVAERKGRWS